MCRALLSMLFVSLLVGIAWSQDYSNGLAHVGGIAFIPAPPAGNPPTILAHSQCETGSTSDPGNLDCDFQVPAGSDRLLVAAYTIESSGNCDTGGIIDVSYRTNALTEQVVAVEGTGFSSCAQIFTLPEASIHNNCKTNPCTLDVDVSGGVTYGASAGYYWVLGNVDQTTPIDTTGTDNGASGEDPFTWPFGATPSADTIQIVAAHLNDPDNSPLTDTNYTVRLQGHDATASHNFYFADSTSGDAPSIDQTVSSSSRIAGASISINSN